jgi:hypothetical protein
MMASAHDRDLRSISRSVPVALERYGWLLTFVACGALGYLTVWQRGLLTDDYSFRAQVVDLVTGERQFYIPDKFNRFLAFLVDVNLAGLMPEYELFVRVLAAVVAAANALLLGWLLYRLVRSRLAAVVAAWLFLSPFYAHQALLWIAAYLYVFSVFFALLYLHACLSALVAATRRRSWIALAVLCYVVAIGFGEQAALVLMLTPVLAIALYKQGKLPSAGTALGRLIPLIAIPAVFALVYVGYAYPGGDFVPRRGLNLSLANLSAQAERFAIRFLQLTVTPNTGLRLINESFRLGVRTLLAAPPAMLLFVIAGGLTLATAALWRPEARSKRSGSAGLIVVGVAWLVAALFFPGIVLVRQVLTVRMLYVPLAGAAVAGAALAWAIAQRLPRQWGERLVILLASGILLASTVCLVGHTRAYQARYQLDQRQLATLAQALPERYLPDGGAYIVAIELDERLFGRTDGLSQGLIGVLQTSWSARDGLTETYRRRDIMSVVNVGWTIKPVEYRPAQGGQPAEVLVTGVRIPVENTFLFAYRNSTNTIIESLLITRPDGQKQTVHFPLAERMRADGRPTITDYPVSNKGITWAGESRE